MKKATLFLAILLSVFICQAKEYASASDWPCEVKTSESVFQIFEPSVETFAGNNLKIRSAISIQKAVASTNEPMYGALWITANCSNDTVNRKVVCDSLRVAKFKCPDAEDMEISYASDLQNALKDVDMTFDLDYVLRLEKEEAVQTQNEAELVNDPPNIICVTNATVLVEIDGSPLMRKLDSDGKYEAVANTPFCLVFDTTNKRYYLKGSDYWLSAPNLQSEWYLTADVPQAIKSYGESLELTADEKEGFKEVFSSGLPQIIVVTEPTELISIDGAPKYKNVEGTDIMYAENTENELFYCATNSKTYVNLSGRWYVHVQEDKWEFVSPDKLPSGFYKMNAENSKESVLPHIQGTEEAKEAIADTYVPQTVKVARKLEEEPEVIYDGTPQFKEIPEAYPVAYAVNTPHDIIRVNDRYYLCEDAVWYESLDPITGWKICINVPSVIYSIPPAYPVYHVRYVRVYNYTPEYVYVGYYPGYVGCFVDRGVVVYGTGYRYTPWIGTYYYPWPATFGFGVSYSLGFGWGFNISWGAPMGWVGYGFCWSNYHWGYYHHPHWHGGHGHWWGRGCGPWDHHHVYHHHGHGCASRYHHGPHCPGGRGPAPGPGQPPRKVAAGRYLVDQPVRSANRAGTPAGLRTASQNSGSPLRSGLRADRNGNVYSGNSSRSGSGRVGSSVGGGSSRIGSTGGTTPAAGAASRVGTTPGGAASRVGTTPGGAASRVGTTPGGAASRIGTTPGGAASRVGTTPGGAATRVGTTPGGAASRIGTTPGGTATRVGTTPGGAATRVGTTPGGTATVPGITTGGAAARLGTTGNGNTARVVNNPSTIGNNRGGNRGGSSVIRSGNGGVNRANGGGAARQGNRSGNAIRNASPVGSGLRSNSSGAGSGLGLGRAGNGGGARSGSGLGLGRAGNGGGARSGAGLGLGRAGGGGGGRAGGVKAGGGGRAGGVKAGGGGKGGRRK